MAKKQSRGSPKTLHGDLRRKLMVDGVMLALPLLFGFGWYVNLVLSSTAPAAGEQLAPSRVQPLILFIFGFIMVYGMFLFYEYRLLYKKWHGLRH
ncbi:hypothetical protein J4453_00630 [Candidatus Woesearchaeota archaeon]|nr:hypothetical protein [Candidatus Woesearchaeota archaeon]